MGPAFLKMVRMYRALRAVRLRHAELGTLGNQPVFKMKNTELLSAESPVLVPPSGKTKATSTNKSEDKAHLSDGDPAAALKATRTRACQRAAFNEKEKSESLPSLVARSCGQALGVVENIDEHEPSPSPVKKKKKK